MKTKLKLRNEQIKTLEDFICHNLGLKNITELDANQSFKLNPDIVSDIKDLILKHKNGKIYTVGDYDVDGIVSLSELELIYIDLGIKNYTMRTPKRLSEGYGLSSKIADEILADNEVSLVILADNGITAVDVVKKLRERNIDVIIIDHHLKNKDGSVPDANIILNPMAFGDKNAEFHNYCTAGLVFKLAQALNIDENSLKIINSFAAIGTVADSVPMKLDNRNIVKSGLKTLTSKEGRTKGLYALLEKFWCLYRCDEDDIGYKLGPCINAAGRLYDDGAKIVFEALKHSSTDDMEQTRKKIEQLFEINNERKAIIAEQMPLIHDMIAQNNLNNFPIINIKCSAPEGVLGILSGQITEAYKKPSFVFGTTPENFLKGSGRSTKDSVHIKKLLDYCSDLLLKYGGHECAGGVSLETKNFNKFYEKANEFAKPFVLDNDDTIPYDFEIDASNVKDWAEKIIKYKPYGEENPQPVFLVKNFKCSDNAVFLGENKKTIKFTDTNGIVAINFNVTPEMAAFENCAGKTFSFVGTINKNIIGKDTVTYQILFTNIEEETPQVSTEVQGRVDKLNALFDSLGL